MSDATNPSALEKLRSDPSSRKGFLRAVGGGAAAVGLAAALAACGEEESTGNEVGGAGVGTARFGQGDVGIVNFALALEYLEVDLYRAAVASGHLGGRPLELAKRFGADEEAHVEALEQLLGKLGGKPAPKGRASFTLDTRDTILSTMTQVESLGAAAYLGQVDRIQSKEVLAAALSIHSVEARHAAAIAGLVGQPISSDGAFARPATSVDVLQQVTPFLATAGS
jgi:rubrerythrin